MLAMWTQGEEQTGDAPGRSSANSDVVLVDGQSLAASTAPPTVANLSITKSSRVHIGPKFISVTQNLQNTEVVKGRFLGLELVSAERARRLRCSVAVFVCWAFLVASGLAIYLIYVALSKQETRLDIGLKEPWYLRRGDWQAMPPYSIDFLNLPVPYVIIGHSAANYCNQRYSCIEQMLEIQRDHLQRGMDDIGPNFLVGGNGLVFEGRGANVFGAMVRSWNVKSITIMFMGNYQTDVPVRAQFEHVNALLKVLVDEHVLTPDYTLYAQCQLQPETVSPGRLVVHEMNHFAHWNSFNLRGCLSSRRLDQWRRRARAPRQTRRRKNHRPRLRPMQPVALSTLKTRSHARTLAALLHILSTYVLRTHTRARAHTRVPAHTTDASTCVSGLSGREADNDNTNLHMRTPARIYYGTLTLSGISLQLTLYDMPFPVYMWHIVRNSSRAERLSCAAALVLLLVCVGLIVYFTVRAKDTHDDITDVAPHEWRISREMWLAQPFDNNGTTALYDPLKLVIIQHTVSQVCTRFVLCAAELRNLQGWFIKSYHYDIPYNFIIGNDGRVYEGRGWHIVGAHTLGYNRCSVGIGFIGDYREELPSHTRVTDLQIKRTMMLLEEGVKLGFLDPNYVVLGAKDVQSTASPGSNLYNAIRQWAHYGHNSPWHNSTCEEMHGLPPLKKAH
ncbi:uncharacterized protein [Battus philenor]|uniref:uncharacterized protein n=1 Tax=Battus philenor TaxID=42288 RepID=UPI0035CF81D0